MTLVMAAAVFTIRFGLYPQILKFIWLYLQIPKIDGYICNFEISRGYICKFPNNKYIITLTRELTSILRKLWLYLRYFQSDLLSIFASHLTIYYLTLLLTI